jgi:hypothetical protein
VVGNAVGVGVGVGSLLTGVWISPPNANVALEIATMVAKRKHRSLFIVFGPFGVEVVWLLNRELSERKNHNINSQRCD